MSICADNVMSFFDEKKLVYETHSDKRGNTVIKITLERLTTFLHFSGESGKYLSLNVYFERVPDDKVADTIFLCNELNKEYKWITTYIDDDNDFVFHDDAILSPESAATETLELWVHISKIVNDVKPRIMKVLYA